MKPVIIILMILSISLAAGSKDNTNGPLPSWQQSESLNIQLGVRDKNASMEFFEAIFLVVSVDGENTYEAKLKVKADEWGYVSFPEDFSVTLADGEYEWKCVVDNKQISSGSFTFTQDQRNLTIPKK